MLNSFQKVYDDLSEDLYNLEVDVKNPEIYKSFIADALKFLKDAGKHILKALSKFIFDKIQVWTNIEIQNISLQMRKSIVNIQ